MLGGGVWACTPVGPAEPGVAAGDTSAPPVDDAVRIKGLFPRLLLFRKRRGRIERLADGARARAGDLLQLGYMAAGNRYGVVVSIDGGGAVTLHYPAQAEGEGALQPRGQHALDHAYELDDARSYERFFFVTSGDEPLPAQRVVDAAKQLAKAGPAARHSDLPLPRRWRQASVTLRKRP